MSQRENVRDCSHLDAVSLPGLLPEQEDGQAGEEASQEAAERAALAQVVARLELLARETAPAAHA